MIHDNGLYFWVTLYVVQSLNETFKMYWNFQWQSSGWLA